MIWMHGTRVNTAYLHKNVALFYPFMMRNRVGHKTSQISPKKPRHISTVEVSEYIALTPPSDSMSWMRILTWALVVPAFVDAAFRSK